MCWLPCWFPYCGSSRKQSLVDSDRKHARFILTKILVMQKRLTPTWADALNSAGEDRPVC